MNMTKVFGKDNTYSLTITEKWKLEDKPPTILLDCNREVSFNVMLSIITIPAWRCICVYGMSVRER